MVENLEKDFQELLNRIREDLEGLMDNVVESIDDLDAEYEDCDDDEERGAIQEDLDGLYSLQDDLNTILGM